MAKKEKVNELARRRLELLKKYYPVDEEKKLVSVKLYYEHASELLDYSVGEEGKEMFSDEFVEKITEIFKRIPFGYKVDVKLEIKDYDVYDETTIMEKFNDFLEINSFDVVRYNKKNNLLAAILILVGITILILNAILSSIGIYGDESGLEYNVLKEVFDITSWVFIWQAVTVMFLSPSDSKIYILSVSAKMNSLSIIRDGEVKITENREEIMDKCMIDSVTVRARTYVLLITSILLIFIGVISVISPFVEYFKNITPESSSALDLSMSIIINIIIGGLLVLAGVLGISKFSNKELHLKWVYVLVFIILIILILSVAITAVMLIMSPTASGWKTLVSIIIQSLTYLLYVISYKAVERKQYKMARKTKQKEEEVQA